MMPAQSLQRRGFSRARIIFTAAVAVFAAYALTVVLVYAQEGGKLTWGADYAKWPMASGYVLGFSHNNGYYRIYGNSQPAADVYRYNGERLRYRDGEGSKKFPVGSVIAMETFGRTTDDKVGAKGFVFFMRKEAAGFDNEGGDWRYGMMDTQGTALADGKAGHATECRKCHSQAAARDFVFAKDR